MEREINNALGFLQSGKTILYPTDTVWGIGGDATNQIAIEKIFRIKKRSESKSMIVLVSDEKMLNKYVREVPAIAWDLIEMSENPLTIVYDDVRGMASGVTAADGSCGIRIVKDAFCKKLIYKFGKPVVSTSANISGEMPPANFGQISSEVIRRVDYTVNWKQDDNSFSKVSSIIKIRSNGEFTLIRK